VVWLFTVVLKHETEVRGGRECEGTVPALVGRGEENHEISNPEDRSSEGEIGRGCFERYRKWLDSPEWNPGRNKRFSSSSERPERLWGPRGTGGSYPGI